MDKEILNQQKNEITEHFIYLKLSQLSKDEHNKKILQEISNDEFKHYTFWKSITKQDLKPNKITIFKYVFLAKVFGLSFALKLMESGEESAQEFYSKYEKKYPHVKNIKKDEEIHEKKLINLLKDERLNYAGSIVLGLNDALVEFTGTLAGLTFAFANSSIIAVTGIIMGIAASLSMAASGYLSSKEEENTEQNPIKAAIYTGIAYIITVILLVIPYFIFSNVYVSLAVMLLITVLIIASYTFYISVAKEIAFKRRFIEMAFISLGVALLSFIIGYSVKLLFNIEV